MATATRDEETWQRRRRRHQPTDPPSVPDLALRTLTLQSPWMGVAMLAAWLLLAASAWASRAPDFCPQGCRCDDALLVVTCVDTALDVIPITLNPAIRRLVLRRNRIRTVHAAFQFYGELRYADLSYNQLLSVPAGTFEAQRRLQELRLDHNRLGNVSARTFQGLRALTALSLRGNFLESVEARQFAGLPLLEELDLGRNRIARVDPLAFDPLPSLRVLCLDDNQLLALPSPALQRLASLAELRVGLNAFAALPDDAFRGLARLSALDLRGAGLVNVSEHAFRGLAALRALSLADNRLAHVPTRQLAALPRLEELSIGQNDFAAIEPDAFQGLTQLRRLDVQGAARLERVRAGALAANLNLEALVLSSNKRLTALEAGALTGLPRLRELVLRDNGLRGLPESLGAAWASLRRLELAGNPLECLCPLLWLRDLLATLGNASAAAPALCAAPPPLRGRPLRLLAAEDLGCATPAARRTLLWAAGVAAALAAAALLGGVSWHCRGRLRQAVKQQRWGRRRPAKDYRKTFSEEDLKRPPPPLPPPVPVPVTEL